MVFLIFALVCASLLLCGIGQIEVIIPLTISSVLVGVLFILAIFRYLKPVPVLVKPHMPEGFLNVLKENYPEVIHKFCVSQCVTIQELREVMACTTFWDFSLTSASVQKKVNDFGIMNLKKDCLGVRLPAVDSLLLKNCPIYFIKQFIKLGSEELPKAANMTPEAYWTASLGFKEDNFTLFDTWTWLFAQEVTSADHYQLGIYYKNNNWKGAENIVKDIKDRMKSRLKETKVELFMYPKVKTRQRIENDDWFLRFYKHGANYEQLQLMKTIGVEKMNLIDGKGLGFIANIYNEMDESSSSYNPTIALSTWEEV
ncbi:DUF1389 domain-containing protein [Chlamydia vaughanii]|uniref:DUF1389 domain-containing protein n=1 Tax=Chlamydia vaughanii TaxID=3112552 RepID=UPI0032B204E8